MSINCLRSAPTAPASVVVSQPQRENVSAVASAAPVARVSMFLLLVGLDLDRYLDVVADAGGTALDAPFGPFDRDRRVGAAQVALVHRVLDAAKRRHVKAHWARHAHHRQVAI